LERSQSNIEKYRQGGEFSVKLNQQKAKTILLEEYRAIKKGRSL
jgi:hypothetical protein